MRTLLLFLLLAPLSAAAQTTFEAAPAGSLPTAAVSGNSMDVRIADLDGDGHPDIVLAKEYARNRVLLNDGKGVFTDGSAGRTANAFRDSEDIAVADFDGNGWPDLVFAAEDDSTHEIYFNNAGAFTDESRRLPQFISNAVVAADLNGDAHPDLVFGNEGQARIFINDGGGIFSDETATRFPQIRNTTQDLLLVDADGDGDNDLVLGNEGGNQIWINQGGGVFRDETLTRFPQGTNIETRKVVAADVNGDGHEDLFFCNMASVAGRDIRDRLYINDGSGVFLDSSEVKLPPELLHTFDAVFTDLNRDGAPDLIVAYMGNAMPAAFINDGRGNFNDSTDAYLPASAAGDNIGVTTGDLNGDGLEDIYFARFRQSDGLFLRRRAPTSVLSAPARGLGLHCYPVPARDVLHVDIRTGGGTGPHLLRLADVLGRTVLVEAVGGNKQPIQIPLGKVPDGLYFLTLGSGCSSVVERVLVAR